MRERAVRGLLLLRFVCLGIVAALRAVEKSDGSTPAHLALNSRLQELGAVLVGVESFGTFQFTNHNTRPVRFLGATSCCVEYFCVREVDLPEVVAPGAQSALSVGVEPRKAVRFKADFSVFSDHDENGKPNLACQGEATVSPWEITD